MASSVEELFAKLQDHVNSEELGEVLSTCKLILAKAPGDPEALECAVVAEVRLNKFQEALNRITQAPESLKDTLTLHKAYCMYRLNQLDEAVSECEAGMQTNPPALLQLQAQVLYRQGNFRECIAKYEELFNQHKLDSQDICTNVLAAYVAAGRAKDVPDIMRAMQMKASDGFEIAYNSATALVELGDFTQADKQLLMAHRVGTEALVEDEATEDEIAQELLPVTVQLGFVAAHEGRTQEAQDLYNSVLKLEQSSDLTSRAVATNNLVALRGPRELFDSLKKFDKLFHSQSPTATNFIDGLASRLSASQKQTLLFNKLLVLLHSNKLPACREVAERLAQLYPTSDVPFLLQAALLLREKKEKTTSLKADEVLATFAQTHPGAVATRVQLMRAQIAASAGNWQRAAEALGAVQELSDRPAVVATCAALMEAAGDINGAEQVLERHLASGQVEHLAELCTTAAAMKEKHGRPGEASALYRRIVTGAASGEAQTCARARLVKAEAKCDLDRAEQEAQHLPAMRGTGDLDLATLEAGEGVLSAAGGRPGRLTDRGQGEGEDAGVDGGSGGGGGKKGVRDGEERKKPKSSRKRKARLPKDFDPQNPGPPPDPERWLPKHERTTFKSKSARRKLKDAVNVKGSQGAGQVAMELEAKLEEPKQEAAKPAVASRPSTASNKAKGKKGKKK